MCLFIIHHEKAIVWDNGDETVDGARAMAQWQGVLQDVVVLSHIHRCSVHDHGQGIVGFGTRRVQVTLQETCCRRKDAIGGDTLSFIT